ncbi:POT family-domain-containing protein [Phlyctochytrium arcticum]|nr:POT family-domain-containing protein [Phlyctochytrium arcticum]
MSTDVKHHDVDSKTIVAPTTAADQLALDEAARRHREKEIEINKHLDAKILENPEKFPRAIFFIIPNEFAERFCFYGITPILKTFAQKKLGYTDGQAAALTHDFKTVSYVTPLAGAALSDSFLDKFKTIVSLSLVYLAGLMVMSITSAPTIMGYADAAKGLLHAAGPLAGLYMVACGTGGIKPCVSSHGGDQFLSIQSFGLNKFYNYFYMSINIGATISGFVTPAVANRNCYGFENDCYSWAFGVCTIAMGAAILLFVAGFKFYRVVPPAGTFIVGTLFKMALVWIATLFRTGFSQARTKASITEKYGPVLTLELLDLSKVLYAAMPAPLFWMAFDQNQGSWQSLSERMVTKNWLSVENTSAVINPIFIVILAPIFANFIYPAIERKWPGKFGLMQRMAVGQILAAVAFVVTVFLALKIEKVCGNARDCVDPDTHIAVLIVPYFIITAGEVLFSISGLNLTYQEVGKRTKASCGAIWLCTSALGNFLAARLTKALFDDWLTSHFLALVAGLCVFAAIIQLIVNRTYTYRKDRPEHQGEDMVL